jgi:hypothetical protein
MGVLYKDCSFRSDPLTNIAATDNCNRPIRKKNCLWRPCLLTDRDRNAMRNFVRGPSIDASYQVTVHLVKRFQRRIFFRNQPIRNKNCPWWPCLSTDRDEMSKGSIYGRSSNKIAHCIPITIR